MNLQHNESLREKLSAEYVLGTLQGGARRRFEHWLRDDAALRRAVTEWQDRLNPMAEFSGAIQPPKKVWQAIARTLNLRTESKSFSWADLRENLQFWRRLGMASTALATILLAVLMITQWQPAASITSYVATLSDDKAQPIAVVTGDLKSRILTVKMVAGQSIAADQSLELWAVPKQGKPRSLGLVAANGSITLQLPDNATPETIPLLAVTLEPKGGSPDPNGPTGPIVFKGAWLRI